MSREINPFIIPFPVTIVTDEAEMGAACLGHEGGAVMGKTIFHFANKTYETCTVDGNWLETGACDVVTKYQAFSVNGRKTMLVNMDHVAYVEVVESCK